VEYRNIEAGLSCVIGIGSDAWDRLFGAPRPAELHPFREFQAASRHAVATPGDLLFHIRARHMDLCFELATQIMDRAPGNYDRLLDYSAPSRGIFSSRPRLNLWMRWGTTSLDFRHRRVRSCRAPLPVTSRYRISKI
jgi:hypothetical protein